MNKRALLSGKIGLTANACGFVPVGEELTYRIEFFNSSFYTLNPVYQVVVSNTLPAGLDPSTVQLVSSKFYRLSQVPP